MPPAIATLICTAFIAYLFIGSERGNRREPISWAPFCWMFIAGSRFVSSWLNMRAPVSVDAYTEGSPVDRAVFFILIVWGALVLLRRHLRWGEVLSSNKWLVAYLLFCLLSITWSEIPGVLAKRWLKDLGNPIMALVLLTEKRPFEAMVTTTRRLALIMLPLSVLFIRYIPALGRAYSYGGVVSYTGVSDQKNTLGLLCLVIGTCLAWAFLFRRDLVSRYELVTGALLLWLLYMADSKTSTTCLIVTIAIFVASTRAAIRRRPTRAATVTICAALLYALIDGVFQIQDVLLALLGRDPTFTHRTELWTVVSALQTNALVGTGFMSFWSGDRMAAVWKALGPGLNQAHNGYLEQYLNLGYVGVAFIVLIAIAGLRSIYRQLHTDYSFGVLRLSFLVMALLYNYTEASFYGINNMWLLFLIAAIEPSAVHQRVTDAVSQFAAAKFPRARAGVRGLRPVTVERPRPTPALPRRSLRVPRLSRIPD